jgi:tripartite-type tricarboxylate transporter receptor subunit TctC
MTMRCLLAAVLAAALSTPALAQSDFPSRPVKVIVDSAPGSATDVINRVISDSLSRIWGQQVLTLNHPGAGGSIAVRAASRAPADGTTFYVGNASVFTALAGDPNTAPNLPIELPRDFIAIGFMAYQPMFIGISPTAGITALPDFIAEAKKRPGALSYGTTGRGRMTHLTMELLQVRAGVQLQMIPYTGGPTAAMPDVTAGRITAVIEAYSGLASGFQGGLIKPLAVSAEQRLPGFENVATVAETLPGFLAGGWNVLLAPVGTPQPIVDKVSTDLRQVIGESEVKTKLAGLGAYARPMTPAEVSAFVDEQRRTWRPIVEKVSKDTAAQQN